MNHRAFRSIALATALAGIATAANAAPARHRVPVLHPQKIASADLAATMFNGPRAKVSTDEGGGEARDIAELRSSDRKWMSGAYKVTGHNVFTTGPKGYEVNEFMYFLTGSVTLTSTDGTVVTAGPGDGVSIPKGWHGKWESEGYSKFYVIYNPAGKVE